MSKTPTRLIWDLSGTLFRPSTEGLTAAQVAEYSFVFLMWSGKKEVSRYDKILYEFMGTLDHQEEINPENIIRDHAGRPIPAIVCSFLSGALTLEEAGQHVLSSFEKWAPDSLSLDDRAHLEQMIKAFFDPEMLARCMRPIESSARLLKEIQVPKDHQHVLSNWDHDSFGHLYRRYQNSVFSHFLPDHIVISADTGFLKPQQEIYTWFMTHQQVDPSDCLFIDDQEENIRAAQALGSLGFPFSENTVPELKEFLRLHGFRL